nr:MAG TPA: tissue-type plasminogen activator [Caudoviricetes sp.]
MGLTCFNQCVYSVSCRDESTSRRQEERKPQWAHILFA